VSIMPPNGSPKPTLRGVAQMMTASPDGFTQEVGALLDTIGYLHEPPVACDGCREVEGACFVTEQAQTIAYAWLLKVIEERG